MYKELSNYRTTNCARPIAQLVERWTPGSASPSSRRSGARYMKILTGMASGWMGAAAVS